VNPGFNRVHPFAQRPCDRTVQARSDCRDVFSAAASPGASDETDCIGCGRGDSAARCGRGDGGHVSGIGLAEAGEAGADDVERTVTCA
jgi:hypothetical protein